MILRLVWENICFRPMRTLLSVLLIGVPVMLILTLVGVSHGFMDDSHRRLEGVGADIIVFPPGHSFTSGSGAPLPVAIVDRLAKIPHVAQAQGIVSMLAGNLPWDTVTGIDYAAFKKMSGGFDFVEGSEPDVFRQPDDLVVVPSFAEEHHVHRGDKVKLLSRSWNVAAIVEPGKMSNAFAQIGVLQDLSNAQGRISQVYLKADDPNNIPLVKKELDEMPALQGFMIYTTKEFVELTSPDSVPAIGVFVHVIIGIGIFTGLFVVSLSMYMAVLQRTREIGILKSLGATKAFVMQLILWEAGAMGIGGTIAGIALSFVSQAALKHFVPASLPQAIVLGWWPKVLGIALGSALLGAVYPGMIAVRQDPIEALAYE
jgi:putative ABC transport system permease protein